MAYYKRPRKKVIRKRNVTIIVIPKKRGKSRKRSSARRGKRWY